MKEAKKSFLEQSINSSFYNRSDSNQSFLKNELQQVIQKNMSNKAFMKQLVSITKQFELKK